MAFNGAFTISENTTLGVIILTDASTGNDPNLTARTIYIYRSDGTLLATANWPLGDNQITLDIFAKDLAMNVKVNYTSSNPLAAPSTYTYDLLYLYKSFGQDFLYQLTQYQLSNPTIIQSENYYKNKLKVIVDMDSAQNALDYGRDIESAQLCVEMYQALIDGQKYYF